MNREKIFCFLSIIFFVAILFSTSSLHAQSRIFATAGTYYFIVPDGVTTIKVECWGAGGAGGTRTGNGQTGGGGGGAYARINTFTVEPGKAYTVVVGAGGNANLVNGGDSWFHSQMTVLADGGYSGDGTINGALGGTVENSVGTVKFMGGKGADGFNGNGNNQNGGGGGSSAGHSDHGKDATGINAVNPPAGGGKGGKGGGNKQNGIAAQEVGGGGGGADRNGANGGNGGKGGDGQVIISWTCSGVNLSNLSVTGTTPVCQGGTTNITIKSTTLSPGTYHVYYFLDNDLANIKSATVILSGGNPRTGSFPVTIPNSANVAITLATMGCGSLSSNNSVNINVTASQPASFTSAIPSTSCMGSTIVYTTQTGKSNYSWTIPGTQGMDYNISAGGTNGNTVTIQWLTAGEKEVSVNYKHSSDGCLSSAPAFNKITINAGPAISSDLSHVNKCLKSSVVLLIAPQNISQVTGYKWYKDGTVISSGSTQLSYTINNLSALDAGKYKVELSGTNGCTSTSKEIILSTFLSSSTTWMPPTESVVWNSANNWSCGIPDLATDAIIPISLSYPFIPDEQNGKVRDLIIDNVALAKGVEVAGLLQVAGTVMNEGLLDITKGTVEFIGTSHQEIKENAFTNNSANNTVRNLIISNNVTLDGPLNITGVLSFGNVENTVFDTKDYLTLKSSENLTARVADITHNGSKINNRIIGRVTVERFIPIPENKTTRRYRLLTSPVKGATVNSAWQEGRTWNGVATDNTNPGFGTLITGQAQGSQGAANGNGFDYWDGIKNSSASIRKYKPSSSGNSNIDAAWVPVENTTDATFDNQEAYLLYVRGNRTFSTGTTPGTTVLRGQGELNQDADATVTVNVPVTQSHTLIGNPYASPIDFRKILAGNNKDDDEKIQTHYWTWQAGIGGNVGGYVLVLPKEGVEGAYEAVPAIGSKFDAEPVIGSGEGFFVMPHPNAKIGNEITIRERHKHNDNEPGLKVLRQADAGKAPAQLRVNVLSGGTGNKALLDGVLARFSDTPEKTNLAKATNSGQNLSILKNNKDHIVVTETLPQEGDSLQLRSWNIAAGNYFLQLTASRFAAGTSAVLYDRHLATETPIDLSAAGLTYEFAVTADAGSKAAQRFVIRFKKAQVLPVTLLSFTAKEESNNTVGIQWKVTGENNIKDYTIEHSTDGTTYKPLQTVLPTGQANEQDYKATHAQPAAVNHYRLKITEATGSIRYSDVAMVNLDLREGATTVYPNPVRGGKAYLKMSNKPAGNYSLAIYNPAGQQVLATVLVHGGGTAALSLPVSSNWAEGIYTIKLTGSKGVAEMIAIHLAK